MGTVMMDLVKRQVDHNMTPGRWRRLTARRKNRLYQQARRKGSPDHELGLQPHSGPPQDIMHAPVEKTIRILGKIIAGEGLFTM